MVTSGRYPYTEFIVTIGTWTLVEEAYLDTGFEGGLLLPAYLEDEILASPDRTKFEIADGAMVMLPAWTGYIELSTCQFSVEVAAMGSRFLLGREILDKLTVCFERGKRVTIQLDE